jgi:hypothetical protein
MRNFATRSTALAQVQSPLWTRILPTIADQYCDFACSHAHTARQRDCVATVPSATATAPGAGVRAAERAHIHERFDAKLQLRLRAPQAF